MAVYVGGNTGSGNTHTDVIMGTKAKGSKVGFNQNVGKATTPPAKIAATKKGTGTTKKAQKVQKGTTTKSADKTTKGRSVGRVLKTGSNKGGV